MTAVDVIAPDLRPGRQKRQVLVDGVYDTLLTFLMSGTLSPGDPVGQGAADKARKATKRHLRGVLDRAMHEQQGQTANAGGN